MLGRRPHKRVQDAAVAIVQHSEKRLSLDHGLNLGGCHAVLRGDLGVGDELGGRDAHGHSLSRIGDLATRASHARWVPRSQTCSLRPTVIHCVLRDQSRVLF